MNKPLLKRAGYTLIEILVVTGIIAFTIPVIFNIVFAILREEVRVYSLRVVKTQGDYILNAMKFNIRNYAISVHSGYPATDSNIACSTVSGTPAAMNPLVMRDRDGNSFYFSSSSGAVASNSSALASPLTLTDSKVSVTGFTMSCNKPNQYSPPIISVSYTVNYATSSAGVLPASFPYQTKIKLRNQ